MGKIIIAFLLCISSLISNRLDDYLIVRRNVIEIKLEAFEESVMLQSAVEGERFYINSVLGDWYEVDLQSGLYGYIHRRDVTLREFREEKGFTEVKEVNDFIIKKINEKKNIGTLNKYTFDVNLSRQTIQRDFEGKRVVYGVKAFEDKNKNSRWIYIADRQLLAIEDNDDNGWVKVSLPNRDRYYYIEKKDFVFSRFPRINGELSKFIIIDNRNQNMLVFQRKNKNFELIRSSMVSTGYDNSRASFRTPPGVFIVANLKDHMIYKNKQGDMTSKGTAPYAIRFSGGNYLHGIPLEEDLDSSREKVLRKWREDLLGSYPLSQGCVRNRDDIAKELFYWIRHRRNNDNYIYPLEAVGVIVIE